MTKYLDDTGLEHFFDNIKDLTRGPSYQQVASYLNAHPESLNDPVADYIDEHPTAQVPNGSITTDKLANNSVTSAKIADGAVTTNDLANGAVTSAKIADGTITTGDLADSSITTAKIADSAVTTAKIANGAVTANKLASDAIPTMSTATAGIAKVGAGLTMYNGAVELNADTTGISGAVDAWLDAHPEATTTVQDGAITPEKASLTLASQFNGYKSIATKTLSISDANYALLKQLGSSSAVDDSSPIRLRIVFAVDAPVYAEAIDSTEICDGVTVGSYRTMSSAIQTQASNRLAVIPTSNSFVTKKVCGVLPAGFISVSMRKADNSVISEEDKATMLSGLSLSLYVLPTDTPTDNDVQSVNWQQFVMINDNGSYGGTDAKHVSLSLDSFFRITKGAEFVSWHSRSGDGFGIRLYDENFEYLGNGGISYIANGTCNVLASNNNTLAKDAAYVKFSYNEWDGSSSLDEILVTVNLVPYKRTMDVDGVSVHARFWEKGTTMTIIPSIPVIAGHRYRVYMKSDSLVRASGYVQVGLGYNGNFPMGRLSGQNLMDGAYFEMVAGTTHPKSRLYLNASGDTSGAGVIIDASIADMTDSSTIARHGLAEADYKKAAIVQKNGGRDGNFNSMLTIVHISDVHGDDIRHQSMVEFAKNLTANDETVVIVNTGDTVRYDGRDGTEFINDTYNTKYGIRYLITVGNHEAFNTRNVGNVTEDYIRQNLIDPLANDSGYVINDDKTYYYVDVASHSMRFVVLNFYEGFAGASTSMTAEQINWFCDTILNTPAGYGLIVCTHAPVLDVVKVDGHGEFYQDALLWRWDIMGYPQLAQIVDAFIGGTQYSGTVGGHEINADFSGKNDNVEFLAWLNGHEHIDRIGYYAKDSDTTLTHDQLVMNVTCTNAWLDLKGADLTYDTADYPYFTEMSDLPRKSFSPTENSFNVYCFDRNRKVARIARIGSDMTYDFKERKIMEIPYATD